MESKKRNKRLVDNILRSFLNIVVNIGPNKKYWNVFQYSLVVIIVQIFVSCSINYTKVTRSDFRFVYFLIWYVYVNAYT